MNTSLVPDDLDGARGILNATVLSLPLWGLILALWHLLTSGGGYPSSTDLRSLAQRGRTNPEGQFSNVDQREQMSPGGVDDSSNARASTATAVGP